MKIVNDDFHSKQISNPKKTKKNARDGIRTQELLRDQVLNLMQ